LEYIETSALRDHLARRPVCSTRAEERRCPRRSILVTSETDARFRALDGCARRRAVTRTPFIAQSRRTICSLASDRHSGGGRSDDRVVDAESRGGNSFERTGRHPFSAQTGLIRSKKLHCGFLPRRLEDGPGLYQCGYRHRHGEGFRGAARSAVSALKIIARAANA